MGITQAVKDGNKALAAKLFSMEDGAMMRGAIIKGKQMWLNPDMKPLRGLQEARGTKWLGDEKIELLELWPVPIGRQVRAWRPIGR